LEYRCVIFELFTLLKLAIIEINVIRLNLNENLINGSQVPSLFIGGKSIPSITVICIIPKGVVMAKSVPVWEFH
jgi:hypothetical protein